MKNRKMRDIKQGLRVVVTAGAAGIGEAIAKTFADRGASVFICDINEVALANLAQERPDIGQVLTDVSDEKQVEDFFESALTALGGIDVLVNNV